MRPRDRDGDSSASSLSPSPSPSPPSPHSEAAAAPPVDRSPPPPRAPLSSLVVKPPHPESDKSSPGPEAGAGQPAHRRESPPQRRRRDLSPRRERWRLPPPPLRRRGSPLPLRRRGSPMGFQSRYPRFHDEQLGYGMHAGSLSPPRRRLENRSFDDAVGSHYVHGYKGRGRGGGGFRAVSPHGDRGGRSYGRGYNAPGKEFINIHGEYVHRNDPNLSPRAGDWICQNPICGNLNFARRTHCNNCNKYRYAPDIYDSSYSPHRRYLNSPPGGSPRRFAGPPNECVLQREMTRYRSPPSGWGVGDPRSYATRSPPDHLGRLPDPVQRNRLGFRGELEFQDRGKFEWEDYNRRDRPLNELYLDRRGRRSGSPWGNLARDLCERSRSPVRDRLMKNSFAGSSPVRDRPMKNSFTGRGGPSRDYADPYASRERPRNLNAGRGSGRGRGRGRGDRQGSDPFSGRGRGDRRVLPRGRNEEVY